MRKQRSLLCYLLLALLFVSVLSPAVCAEEGEYFDSSVFDGKRVGVQTGSTAVELAPEYFKDPEMNYFVSTTDLFPALLNNKIDVGFADEPILRYGAAQVGGMQVERLESAIDSIAIVCAKTEKGDTLRAQLNSFITALDESGELTALQSKWFDGSEEQQTMEDYTLYPDTNGVLAIGSEVSYPPFQFVRDGMFVGYEIELAARFCKEYGYRPDFQNYDFAGIIAAVNTGKLDLGVSGFTVTEERMKSVNFTVPHFYSYLGVVFMDEEEGSGVLSPADHFRSTFLHENRWKSFLSGAFVTLRISALSILFGTVLGFGWYLLYRRKNPVVVSLTNALLWLLNGLPVVVLLMIFYYLVFTNGYFDGEQVSVLCFSFLFAGFMLRALENGEKAVDSGQALAADAMGYSNLKAFFRIIFPQTARFVWPNYIGEICSHIKSTAVVGYIAVVDITKVGDLIRGITYDAFFPLLFVAAAYFLMTALLQSIARLIAKKTDPFSRSQEEILKGVVLRNGEK